MRAVALWLIEGGVVTLWPGWLIWRSRKIWTSCEKCSRFMKAKVLANTHVGIDAKMKAAMEGGDFDFLLTLGDSGDAREWYRVSVESCKTCEGTRLLCVERCAFKKSKEREPLWIVPRLILTEEAYARLQAVCKRLEDAEGLTF